VNGYINAVFSGLPAVEIATIISDYIIPNEQLYGLYHLASNSISKYDLLKLISNVYNKKIQIIPDNKLIINRSLNDAKFKLDTGYISKKWPVLIEKMYDDFINSYSINNSEN
jgi:dTDP-4-dehydrorhamnose reductase